MAVRKTVPIHKIPRLIGSEVRKEMKKTNRNPEELLFEALARGGLIPVDLERREIRINAVRAALETLTPRETHVLWEHAVKGKKFQVICDSEDYKALTKKGFTSMNRVVQIYRSAELKFKRSINNSGILEREK